MVESTLPGEEGKKVMYPKMRLKGSVTLDTVAKKMSQSGSFTKGDIIGLVKNLTQFIAWEMADGHSVKIEGLGTFTPALGLRKGAKRESGIEGEPRRNATSICLDDIHFRPSRELLKETGRNCKIERSTVPALRSSSQFTAEERLSRALDFLESNPFMRVRDYMQLTGLLHDAAARELKKWADTEGSGIVAKGRGSHKVYVRKNISYSIGTPL